MTSRYDASWVCVRPGELRVAVEQGAAVERREQPLVRVEDERVGLLDPGVLRPQRPGEDARSRRRRRRRGTTSRARGPARRRRRGRRRCRRWSCPRCRRPRRRRTGRPRRRSPRARVSAVSRWSGVLDDERVHLQQPQGVDDRRVRVGADDDAQSPARRRRPAASWRSRGPRPAPTGCRPSRRRRSSRPRSSGSPASSAISRSTVFSAAMAPDASSQEMPWIDAQETSMSNSRLALVGRGRDEPEEARAVGRDDARCDHRRVDAEHLVRVPALRRGSRRRAARTAPRPGALPGRAGPGSSAAGSPRTPGRCAPSARWSGRPRACIIVSSSGPRPARDHDHRTGECRTIFVARDPRNTRATGPSPLDPTTSTSPSSHSTSSRASLQRRAATDRRSRPARGRSELLDLGQRGVRHGRSSSAVHCCEHQAPRRPCRAWWCRPGSPTPRTTRAAARRPRRAPQRPPRRRGPRRSEPPYAAVTRVTVASGLQRKPRGASATGTGELCSSRSVTLPSATWPNAPAEDEPSTRRRASCCSASSSSPTGRGPALCRTKRGLDAVRQRGPGPRSRAASAVASRCSRYSASTRAMPGDPRRGDDRRRPRGRRPPERASMPARWSAALPAPIGRVAHDHRHGAPP